MSFLIQIYMGTWHVKMDVIFHSRAQREMTFYQVWGSPVIELLWVLPADNLICSSKGCIHSFHGKTEAKEQESESARELQSYRHCACGEGSGNVKFVSETQSPELGWQGDSAALRRTWIRRAEHNLTLEGKIIQLGSEYETSGLHLFHCQFSHFANLKMLSMDTLVNSFVQIILHFILRAK